MTARLSPDKVFNKQNASWYVHSDFVLDYKCRTPPEDEGERRQRPMAYAGLNWTSASIAIATESAINKQSKNKRGPMALASKPREALLQKQSHLIKGHQ